MLKVIRWVLYVTMSNLKEEITFYFHFFCYHNLAWGSNEKRISILARESFFKFDWTVSSWVLQETQYELL